MDIFDLDGMSALHLAAEQGHNIVCDALLASKAFVNSKSRVGLTPLHLAALKGYTELVRSLVTTHKATIDSLTLVNRLSSTTCLSNFNRFSEFPLFLLMPPCT